MLKKIKEYIPNPLGLKLKKGIAIGNRLFTGFSIKFIEWYEKNKSELYRIYTGVCTIKGCSPVDIEEFESSIKHLIGEKILHLYELDFTSEEDYHQAKKYLHIKNILIVCEIQLNLDDYWWESDSGDPYFQYYIEFPLYLSEQTSLKK